MLLTLPKVNIGYLFIYLFIIFNEITEQTTSSHDNSEVAENPQENTKDIIYSFLEDTLKINNARSKFKFQGVHQVGKTWSYKARPIIARFLRYANREDVLSKTRITLKDANFSVFEDIPKELYELRIRQFKKFKEAKKKGLSVWQETPT